MGDKPNDGESSDEKIRVSVTLPKKALDELVANSPVRADYQDGIETAVETQLEIDNADEYTIVKNRE
ncbi:hypothetical protein Htur_5015 (plasmid) [Haloterrigena turkmenica DSM 5511]|uniref:Uncharacterized protein n=1 Tax=Haloterrigena turkmenica (strain ATCC 51198 / DSM 5511 / JCM 9101 / NCIMB 13204 / VKM B-1734 / 4k) TaxID=543526 RepID=D2S3F6_HALTV|nr:hypothetical protein [Haloterrigena turkmenica]ADB63903.1 hypothetical protein Htur_5015 [Haloterrigena turkmenica DSM 5511]